MKIEYDPERRSYIAKIHNEDGWVERHGFNRAALIDSAIATAFHEKIVDQAIESIWRWGNKKI